MTCGGTTTTLRAGRGTLPIACDFPTAGSYRVEAVVVGDRGFQASSAMTVVVTWPAPIVVPIFYSVIETSREGADVVFSIRSDLEATRYTWDFGDSTPTVTTLLPQTRHPFTSPSSGLNERIVTVRATDGDRTVATGRVVGRW